MSKPGCAVVCRTEPLFRDAAGRNPSSLMTARVSRLPITIRVASDGRIHLDWNTQIDCEVFVDGARVSARVLPATALESGILLRLGSYVLLRLAIFETDTSTLAAQNADEASNAGAHASLSALVGHTPVMRALRSEVARLAALDIPVLLRGETGAGKELVATALHGTSRRRDRPYLRVNSAAIPPLLAAGELFGYSRGAFTGAVGDRAGYFVEADGGTLFLDEIGALTPEVQSVLLRTIETGEIQPLGTGLRSVSVRLLAATELDLDAKIERGSFSRALLQRFGYELWVPPLREHLGDLSLLLAHFLKEELRALGESARLGGPEADLNPYLSSDFVLQLEQYAWPGNVRELRSVVRRFAIHNQGRERTEIEPRLRTLLQRTAARVDTVEPPLSPSSVPPPSDSEPPALRREAFQLKDQDVLDALRRCAFEIDRTARELGVSRSWLHARMNTLTGVRKAKDLGAAEIRSALEQNEGVIERAARQLEVSAKGLQLQITRLGLRHGNGNPAM
jgi:two-component system, NtrC family, nitrogen regulation response regulator GlnG